MCILWYWISCLILLQQIEDDKAGHWKAEHKNSWGKKPRLLWRTYQYWGIHFWLFFTMSSALLRADSYLIHCQYKYIDMCCFKIKSKQTGERLKKISSSPWVVIQLFTHCYVCQIIGEVFFCFSRSTSTDGFIVIHNNVLPSTFYRYFLLKYIHCQCCLGKYVLCNTFTIQNK